MLKLPQSLALALTTAALLTTSSATYAAATKGSAGSAGGSQSPSTQILGKIYGFMVAAEQKTNAMVYQYDNLFSQIMQSNTALANVTGAKTPVNLNTYLNTSVASTTSNAVSTQLAQFPMYITHAHTAFGETPLASALFHNPDAPPPKSLVPPAGDNLALAFIKPPSDALINMGNTSMDASAFLMPTSGSYDTSVLGANSYTSLPRMYLNTVSDISAPLTGGSGLNALRSVNSDYLPYVVNTLVNTSAYRNYQSLMRSTIAAKSMAFSVLNAIFSERTPLHTSDMKPITYCGSGSVSGIPSQWCNSDDTASPLQIENYQAYNRLYNPSWFKAMRTASPATIARQNLYLQAEILAKLQQLHLDNERQQALAALGSFQNINLQSTMVTMTSMLGGGVLGNMKTTICGAKGILNQKVPSELLSRFGGTAGAKLGICVKAPSTGIASGLGNATSGLKKSLGGK